MIPVMVKIAEGIYGSINFRGSIYKQHSLHLEAAKFVDQICKTSELTLQMFIAGGGLPLLVRHMQVASDVRKNNDIGKIVAVGIDGILEVFKLQTIRRDDFCHLFVKLGCCLTSSSASAACCPSSSRRATAAWTLTAGPSSRSWARSSPSSGPRTRS